MPGTLSGNANPDPIIDGAILRYIADQDPATFAGRYIDRDAGGTIVVAFTDDREGHLEALLARRPSPDDPEAVSPMPPIVDDRPLGEQGVVIDVVTAQWSELELQSGRDAMERTMVGLPFRLLGSGTLTQLNRVSVMLSEQTAENIAAMAEVVEVNKICLEGERPTAQPSVVDPVVAGNAPLTAIPEPGADPIVGCGPSLPLSAYRNPTPIEELDDPAVEGLVAGLSEDEGASMVQEGWSLLDRSETQATFTAGSGDATAFVTVEQTAGGWRWAGSSVGECELRGALPAGLGVVTWRLDPAFDAPGPDDTSIHVLLREQGCASGQEIGDRLRGPEVVTDEEVVRIAFAVVPPGGGTQTCPASPELAVEVPIGGSLGDRSIVDGLVVEMS